MQNFKIEETLRRKKDNIDVQKFRLITQLISVLE